MAPAVFKTVVGLRRSPGWVRPPRTPATGVRRALQELGWPREGAGATVPVHRSPGDSIATAVRRALQELGWRGDASTVRGPVTLARDPSTGRRRPLVAGVGLVARCGVWRWSPAVTARTVDRVRERFPLRESARLRDRAVGDGPAPGCARCRTGRDAQAPRVSAATSASRRAGSDLRQARPETRSPGWAPSRTAAPTPAERGECPPRLLLRRGANAPRARMCALPNGTRRARTPSVRCNERLSTRRLGPPAGPSRDAESRLGPLKNGRAYSCSEGRMPPRDGATHRRCRDTDHTAPHCPARPRPLLLRGANAPEEAVFPGPVEGLRLVQAL